MKKNTLLAVALSLPLAVIAVVAISVYVSGLLFQPRYNFLYSLNKQYWINEYRVQNGKITIQKKLHTYGTPTIEATEAPQIYFYDVKKNQSKAISFVEATQFDLNSNTISPDGFKVQMGISGGVPGPLSLFAVGNNDIYIVGHQVSHKINTGMSKNSNWGFHFIGWISDDRTVK